MDERRIHDVWPAINGTRYSPGKVLDYYSHFRILTKYWQQARNHHTKPTSRRSIIGHNYDLHIMIMTLGRRRHLYLPYLSDSTRGGKFRPDLLYFGFNNLKSCQRQNNFFCHLSGSSNVLEWPGVWAILAYNSPPLKVLMNLTAMADQHVPDTSRQCE